MKTVTFIAKFLSAAAVASLALAAPPTDKPGKGGGGGGKDDSDIAAFDPEIVYLYRKNNNYELRLTDRSQSRHVRMNDIGRVYSVSISSENARTVAFMTLNDIYLQRWTTGDFALSPPELVLNVPAGGGSLDFSRNDDKLAFITGRSSGDADIVVYDIANDSASVVLSGWRLSTAFFSPVDDRIFFVGAPPGASTDDGIYHFLPGQTVPTRIVSKAGNFTGENIDITRSSGLGTPLIVTDNNGDAVFFRLDGAQVTRNFGGERGFNYHFGCNNEELLFIQVEKKNGIAIADFSGNIEFLDISWADSRRMDWMERDPCV